MALAQALPHSFLKQMEPSWALSHRETNLSMGAEQSLSKGIMWPQEPQILALGWTMPTGVLTEGAGVGDTVGAHLQLPSHSQALKWWVKQSASFPPPLHSCSGVEEMPRALPQPELGRDPILGLVLLYFR